MEAGRFFLGGGGSLYPWNIKHANMTARLILREKGGFARHQQDKTDKERP